MAHVLVVEVDGNIGYLLQCELQEDGHEVALLSNDAPLGGASGERPRYDVVIMGMRLPSRDSFRALSGLKRTFPSLRVFVFSDTLTLEDPALFRSGADEFFLRHEIGKMKERIREGWAMPTCAAGNGGVSL